MSTIKKRKNPWLRVTNEYVCTFAVPECTNCKGRGFVGDPEKEKPVICSCATLAFRRERQKLEQRGAIRERKQRIGNRDVKWLEWRNLTAV